MKLARFLLGHRALCTGALITSVLASGCSDESVVEERTITIGLLLPFTGSASGTAANLERAVIYAADRVNEGGGIDGWPLRIVARDTHSNIARSKQSAMELLAEDARVIIGPESPEIAAEIAPLFAQNGALFLSPLVGAAGEPQTTCDVPWYRLAPSAKSMGEAIAKRLAAAGVEHAAVLSGSGAYNRALSDAVIRRFTSLGGTVNVSLSLDANDSSYADEFETEFETDPEAVVLATDPRAAALAVTELASLSRVAPRWFLSPLLKTDLLVQNVAPDALEDAVGVAPKIYDRTSDFPDAFAARWAGDAPLEGAYFYYDAIGLIAFALQGASTAGAGTITPEALQLAMLRAAAPPGEAVGWDELENSLARLRDGDDLYYSGLTGPLLMESCGARKLGVTSEWTVQSGAIVDRE
jgi:branched-chain amino acid transport system substrate-binding protein